MKCKRGDGQGEGGREGGRQAEREKDLEGWQHCRRTGLYDWLGRANSISSPQAQVNICKRAADRLKGSAQKTALDSGSWKWGGGRWGTEEADYRGVC